MITVLELMFDENKHAIGVGASYVVSKAEAIKLIKAGTHKAEGLPIGVLPGSVAGEVVSAGVDNGGDSK